MSYQVGQKLGNYRLVRLLGSGGFAEVYLGKHIYLHTLAAIKVLQIQLTSEALQNFLKEARIIANLEHPNIVRVLEFGIEYHRPYLVMNYAPNGTLRQRYPRGRQLAPVTTLALLKQVVSALNYAHSRKIIHRDIKPENMLLGTNKTVLLSDFGLALEGQSAYLSRPTDKAGTMLYMAPEQFRGNPCSASDQYALGVVVYEWLCGALPFEGPGLAVVLQHAQQPPIPLHKRVPALPVALSDIVMHTLEKEPEERFAHVQEFAEAFEAVCSNHAALFTLSNSTQLFSEESAEAQSSWLEADTHARFSSDEDGADPAGTIPFDSQSLILPKGLSQPDDNHTHPPLEGLLNESPVTSRPRAQTLIINKTTKPGSPAIRTQHIDSEPAALPLSSRSFVSRVLQSRKRALLVGLSCLGIVLCLGSFWTLHLQDPSMLSHKQTQQSIPGIHTPTKTRQRTDNTGKIISKRLQGRGGDLTASASSGTPASSGPLKMAPSTGATPLAGNTPTPMPTLQVTPPASEENQPTPTQLPIATPTPLPTQGDGPLIVYISSVPNTVQSGSTVQVGIACNRSNAHIRLRILYSSSGEVDRSHWYRTDQNGHVTILWHVEALSQDLLNYTIASLIVVADNGEDDPVFSLPVVVQVV